MNTAAKEAAHMHLVVHAALVAVSLASPAPKPAAPARVVAVFLGAPAPVVRPQAPAAVFLGAPKIAGK